MKGMLPILLTSALLAGCAASPRDPFVVRDDAPAWPAPPEEPRIHHVTSIYSREDLFTPGNLLTNMIGIVAGEEDTRLVRPFAVAIHPGGGVLVADMGARCVHFFDIPARKYRALGRDREGGLPSPVGVAAAADGSILVSDSRLNSIERFGRDGKSLGRFAPDHEFQRPGGIAINGATGEVMVADVLAHTIVVFAPDGVERRVIGGNGEEPGRFNFPTHLALDGDGNLLVADSMNFRIQRLTPEGGPLAQYGRAGDARGDFARPKGVEWIDTDVYAAVEGLYDSLIFFNGEGGLLLSVGEAGSGPGQFWLPAGLAMDHQRQLLFVADSYNSRVQVFRMMTPGGNPGDSPAGKGAVK